MMNILIPTDFSENSENAIRYALDYFSEIPVNFYLIHISEENESSLPLKNRKISSLKNQLTNCKLWAKNPIHTFSAINEQGLLVEAIRKQVAEKEIDFMVLGTKGTSKESSIEKRSNTWEIITKVKCPVFIIPPNAKFKSLLNISLLTDYNCIYRHKVISTLSEALQLQQAALRVLHIRLQNLQLNSAQTDNKGFLHYFFRDSMHSFHYLDNNKVEAGLQDFVKTWEIGLIAVVAKNLNLMQRLLFNPHGQFISFPREVPFLILHE